MLERSRFLNVLTKQVSATLLLSKIRCGNFFMGKSRRLKDSILLRSYNPGSSMEN